jgi:hypothetical protein
MAIQLLSTNGGVLPIPAHTKKGKKKKELRVRVMKDSCLKV